MFKQRLDKLLAKRASAACDKYRFIVKHAFSLLSGLRKSRVQLT
jgi:hypothetical protein